MDLERMLADVDTLCLDELYRLCDVVVAHIAAYERQQPIPSVQSSDALASVSLPADAIRTANGYLRQEYATCGNPACKRCVNGPGHGPYWYRYTYRKGGGYGRQYVGEVRPAD